MSAKQKGRLFVAAQFALLGLLMVLPSDQVGAATSLAADAVGFIGLGKSLTANPVPLEHAKLMTRGIYKYLRHPIYSGLLLLTFGWTLAAGSVMKWVLWLVLLVLLIQKLKFEEQLLRAKFAGYAAYSQNTKRLIPFIF